MRFTIAAVLAGAGLAAAQNVTISSACQTALTNILASPDAACLNPSGLVSLVVGGTNASVVNPINSWLKTLCTLGQCSNATLAAVTTNITTGCSSDLSAAGISTSDAASLVTYVQEFYPTVRQVVCLQDNSDSNTLCVTEVLTNIQTSFGTPLTISNIITDVSAIVTGTKTVPSNILCNDCVKEAYNLIDKQFPSLIEGAAAAAVASACGATFTNGATPTEIAQVANTAAAGAVSSKSNGATLLSVNSLVAVAVSGLVAVSSAFAVLA